jgi:hypothetical protein
MWCVDAYGTVQTPESVQQPFLVGPAKTRADAAIALSDGTFALSVVAGMVTLLQA